MPLAKDIPACPNPPAQRPPRQVTRDYTIELLTPMFGGGVVASEPDDSMPFRSTSIRGHLQFWWRATKGAQFETAKELAQRHEEIWGSTKRASPVIVEVFAERFEARRCANFVFRQGAYPKLSWDSSLGGADELAYVLFPFQGKATRERVEKEPSKFIPTGSFHLRLLYPESLEEDVTASVRSWVNFGGLGARTRRGCGAVYCKEFSPLDRRHLTEMLVTLSKYGNGSPRPWPTAAAATLLGVKKDNALASWQEAVKALRDFRQAPGLGRNVGQGARPGRSRFPEPETIRKVTQKRSQEHRRLDHIPDDAFPRGEFGLPINFHFKDMNAGDPPDTQLYPILPGPERIKSDRMASPLILRALRCANGETYPVIVRLQAQQITRVVLVKGAGQDLHTNGIVSSPELSKYSDSPLRWAPTTGSALDAFIGFVKAERQFQEAGA